MRNFQSTFETRKRSFIWTFSIFITVLGPVLGMALNLQISLAKRLKLKVRKFNRVISMFVDIR